MKKLFLILFAVLAMSLSACDSSSNKYTVTFDSNGGSSVPSQTVAKGDKIKKPNNPTRNGYDFVNWTYQGEEWSFFGYVVTEDMTLLANWSTITYNITYELNGGTNSSSNPSTYTAEDTINLANPLSSPTGYSFAGWTLNGNPISTIQAGTYGNLTLVATWSIDSYIVTVASSDTSKGTVSGSGTYEYNSEVTVVATPNNGYELDGWYSGSAKKSSSISYIFTMPASDISLVARWNTITYNITYELNGGTNSSSNPSTYTMEDTVALSDPYKTGYSFAGWTFNGNPISTIQAGTYGNLTLVATWSINSYTVTVTSSDTSKGTVSGSGTYEYNSEVAVVATPATDYVFNGWYSDSELTKKVSSNATYIFTMSTSSVSLYAKFWTQAEEWNANHGVVPVVDAINNQVTYGLYPQTLVDDTSLISALNGLDDSSIDTNNGWYLYENEYYAKIDAKPYESGYTFDNGTTIVSGDTYWFLCEVITWDIFTGSDDEYYLLSNKLLDAHCYYTSTSNRTVNGGTVYPNNYKYSDIRAWLNGYDGSSYEVQDYTDKGFLDTAFALNSNYINTTTVDNRASTTDYYRNQYACDNTQDKVFLPSYKDYYYRISERQAKTTDYAKANGAIINTTDYLNNGWYWTRSPRSEYSTIAWTVDYDGSLKGHGLNVSVTSKSVRPSISLQIS